MKGAEAKEKVVNVLKDAFKNSFIGIVDKKIYVWSEENGEQVQVAISLTCPKTPVKCGNVDSSDSISTTQAEHNIELSNEDKQAVERLKNMLGI